MTLRAAILTATATLAVTAPASAHGYLHMAEARLLTHRAAINLQAKVPGSTYELGRCFRHTATFLVCWAFLTRRDAQGLVERTRYRVSVRGSAVRAVARAVPVVTYEVRP